MRFLLLILFLPCTLSAQIFFPKEKIFLRNEMDQQHFLFESVEALQQVSSLSLVTESIHSSPLTYHVRMAVQFMQIPLVDQYITLHFTTNHQLLSYQVDCHGLNKLIGYNPASDFAQWSTVHPEKLIQHYPAFYAHIKNSFLKIDLENDQPELILEAHAWSKTYDKTLLLRSDTSILRELHHERYWNDTTIQAKVFHPDPLSALQQSYGGVYVDSNDGYQTWQDSATMLVTIPARFDNGLFYPQNDLVTLDEFEGPVFAPVLSANPDFFYTRNESGFEDMMVLYHLTHFHDYIASLGYDSLMLNGVLVDAHAQFGADNSVFTRNGGNPTLRFGTGGVDDAEDADVIIHEYAHGLSWSANGNDNFSFERTGLDEGLADYFATSYSRAMNANGWQAVFNWDGHNEFWGGRSANTLLNYPNASSIYTLGEIWNTAMSSIATDVGLIVSDKLMLEALYFFTDETTLPQAAQYVLQADTVLFGAQHAATLCARFQQKNLLDANCKPVGLSAAEAKLNPMVYNSDGFASGSGNLRVQMPLIEATRFELFNATMQCVLRNENKKGELLISPQTLSSGMYYLKCYTAKKLYTIKIIRF